MHQDVKPEGGEIHAAGHQVQAANAHQERHEAQTANHVGHRYWKIFRVNNI